ncbi:ABC-type transport auxiliary lipoprotein family protein [Lysobacter sp. LF1]|uniref:ABC-type transport auxiliary lipoprotein family protein n=1 Tax=Lysobacter stagni TaxID=3045172 RepID=A0ABT6XF20_9GAMM|nr:ABC-type transport auxiliary lipoprotein family protein [Lysobacter sp. LF1]MDI9238751.1 ABC-type transport auxiliary lipoprotein family protein [Lysobacter sp. LF1]
MMRARHLLAAGLAIVLAGCSILSDKPKSTSTIYAPDPRVQADANWPRVDWQLVLAPPNAARIVDSLRIAVRPTPGELQVYRGAQWARTPSDMLQDTLLRTLEDSGRIAGVARQGSGMAGDFRLVLDIRRFEADYAQAAIPSATIEVSAKLLNVSDQRVAASRVFVQAQPAATTAVPDVAHAFEQSLQNIGHDIAGWTLTSGESYRRNRPPAQG